MKRIFIVTPMLVAIAGAIYFGYHATPVTVIQPKPVAISKPLSHNDYISMSPSVITFANSNAVTIAAPPFIHDMVQRRAAAKDKVAYDSAFCDGVDAAAQFPHYKHSNITFAYSDVKDVINCQ